MMTNKNKTITAPTYTSTSAIAKNSACSNNHKPAALKKESTRNNADKIGFLEVITLIAEKSKIKEKK